MAMRGKTKWSKFCGWATRRIGIARHQPIELRLLADVNRLFDSKNESWMASQEIVQGLTALEDRTWRYMPSTGRQITASKMACMLKPLGIKPFQKRIRMKVRRGYDRRQFIEASKNA